MKEFTITLTAEEMFLVCCSLMERASALKDKGMEEDATLHSNLAWAINDIKKKQSDS